jgi:hypothetical protein
MIAGALRCVVGCSFVAAVYCLRGSGVLVCVCVWGGGGTPHIHPSTT